MTVAEWATSKVNTMQAAIRLVVENNQNEKPNFFCFKISK